VKRRRRPARRRPAPPRPPDPLEARLVPLVKEVARIAGGDGAPLAKLEGMLEILFGAYGAGAPEFTDALVAGWVGARRDVPQRLALAWQREQLRLCLADVLAEGQRLGAVRAALDPGATAALALGAAEAGLLHTPIEGGAVGPAEQLRALLALVRTGA
jgi:hypothetical protein